MLHHAMKLKFIVMKELLLFLLLLRFLPLTSQVIDDFETGNCERWKQSPSGRWSCSGENPLDDRYSLKHSFDNSESGTDCISIGFDDIDLAKPVEWEFDIRYEYSPSASNNWAVYLVSEKASDYMNATSNNQSVILGVNQTGSNDLLTLYHQDGNKVNEVLSTSFNWQDLSDNAVFHFDIKYDGEGKWLLYGGVEDTSLIGTAEFLPPLDYFNFFGLKYAYTSSKDRLLSFDNFSLQGALVIDTIAPVLRSIDFPTRKSFDLLFSENIYAGDDFQISLAANIKKGRLWPFFVSKTYSVSLKVF